MAQKRLGNGSLMKNKRKEPDNESHTNWPDYDGPMTVKIGDQEVELEVAAWIKVADKESKRLNVGDKYFSLSIREKWQPETKPADDDQPPF